MNKGQLNTNLCLICGSHFNSVISTKIREMKHDVLSCNECGFVFLSGCQKIDYSASYGSLTFNKGMDRDKQVIVRSNSLSRFNSIVCDLINQQHNDNIKILEIGAGVGASIYGLKKLIEDVEVDCIEINNQDRAYIENRFSSKVYKDIFDVSKKYDVIYGHHVFEHFIDPKEMLDKIYSIAADDCKLYISFPNFDDFYKKTLEGNERRKYLEFNYHIAHPYYYTRDTFLRLIGDTIWEVESLTTIQDYSIVNYFNWYINGSRSKNIQDATNVNDSIDGLNKYFIAMIEKENLGNNISVILKKKKV